jgi:hypothetical protein
MWYQIKVPYKDQVPNQQWITNTVSVNWEWKSYAVPDTFIINVSVTESWATTKEAQTKMENKILKIKEVLWNNDIKKEKVKTVSVNVYPEEDWNNWQRKLLWYRSTQTVEIEINWSWFTQKWSKIISQLGDVWGININNTYFNLKDKDKAVQEARTKAFENAKQKAQQLAKLWDLDLWKATMISESESSNMPSPYPIMYAKAESNMWGWVADMNTQTISAWQNEIVVYLNIVYELK